MPRHVQEGASSRAVRAPQAGGPAQGCALAEGAASATSAPPHIHTRAATGGRHLFSPLFSGPPETSFWGWKSTCWVSAPLSAREGSFKVLFIYFFSIQLQTWGVWRCCCWVGIFWSHLFIRGDDFQLQGCCLQLRQLLKAHPGLVRGGKKVEMQMQSDVCSTQKSPLRAGGCLAKSKRALSQAEAGNYVLYFSGLSKEAVSRQTF